ncbi:MAG TPA: diguanylate cyclase [Candidatus Limnocylindrales bacterium]|nr:diguanylate cyclase [Candidatus Limnocylindrales bacterium]
MSVQAERSVAERRPEMAVGARLGRVGLELTRSRPVRAARWITDPWIVAGAVLAGAGAGAWALSTLPHYDPEWIWTLPLAIVGLVLLAGRIATRRVREQSTHLEVLQAAAARMNRATTVEAVGRTIVEEIGRIVEYHNARVYVLEGDELAPIAIEGRVGEYDFVDLDVIRCRIGEGFTGWVAQHGVPLRIDDANGDPRGQTIAGTEAIDESMLVVPMRHDERTIGVITLSKLGLRQFSAGDLRLLTILADHAATAVETTRLLGRSAALTADLRRLLDMSAALSRSLDSRQVSVLMARHLSDAIGADECAVSYVDRVGDRILTTGYWPPQAPGAVADEYPLEAFPATREALRTRLPLLVDADDPGADPAEVAYLRKFGLRTLYLLPLVAKGEAIGMAELYFASAFRPTGSAVDLALAMSSEAAMALENARLYEAARAAADHDPLTGFLNHRAFHERLGEEILRAGRSRASVGLLMLDMDDFKVVNDTFGHLLGDRVLVWTADLIRASLRVSDVPARYGGDEFAVILPGAGPDEARAVAGRIRDAFASSTFQAEGRGPVPIGISIGAAIHPADGLVGTELIAAADAALYAEKRARGVASVAR